MQLQWISAFLDLSQDGFDRAVAFWRGVTGYDLSPARGVEGEFATLVPPTGDDFLRVQRLLTGPPRLHVDLHVADPAIAASEAVGLGARVLARRGYVVLASPGGFVFCFVGHSASQPPPAAEWSGGHRSVVDQVCLDIPADRYHSECDFWQRLTGRELRRSPEHAEFQRLVRPPDQPLHLLLQRLGEEHGQVGAHLDLAASDRAAETARHVALGAEVIDVRRAWTVLLDPAGATYCITDRAPETRMPEGSLGR